jgi:hypothetical protein
MLVACCQDMAALDAVHLERVDQPVRVTKALWLRRDVGIARWVYAGAATRAPYGACPITAERDIKYLIMISTNVAIEGIV